MTSSAPEYFVYKCPHCSQERNAVEVAEGLPVEVLRLVTARRNGRLRKNRSVAGGRPSLARCPGCAQQMSAMEMREHRLPCVRKELNELRGVALQLTPKDPDPFPYFYVHHIDEANVEFKKGSNGDIVTVDLRKIAEIDTEGFIRVLGRIGWHDDIKRWRFGPTASIGRPRIDGAPL